MSLFKKRSFAACAAMGTGCALALTALLCVPLAWAITRELLPEPAAGAAAAAAVGLSALAATAVIVRSRGRQALATGGAIGGGVVLAAALLCALGGSKSAFGPWLAWVSGAALAGGLTGALACLRQNTHKKRRR